MEYDWIKFNNFNILLIFCFYLNIKSELRKTGWERRRVMSCFQQCYVSADICGLCFIYFESFYRFLSLGFFAKAAYKYRVVGVPVVCARTSSLCTYHSRTNHVSWSAVWWITSALPGNVIYKGEILSGFVLQGFPTKVPCAFLMS
jgi:hypothetical protein